MDEIVLTAIKSLISRGLQDKSISYEVEDPHDLSYYVQKGSASELVLKVESSLGKFKLKLPAHVQGLFYTGSGFMSTVNSLKRKSDILYKKGKLTLGDVVVNTSSNGNEVESPAGVTSPQVSHKVIARLKYHTGYSGPDTLCDEMIKSAMKLLKTRNDNMIDYYISTYDHALAKYLSSARISKKIISNIKHTVSKKSPKLDIITDAIGDFLHAGTHSEYVTAVNAYTLIASSSKLKIPPYFLLNESFYDVVDVIDTPINGHVNILNSICTGVNVRGKDLYIDVYDKEFNLLSLPYEEYATARVLVSDEIDYENKVVPDEYQVLYCGKIYDDLDEYDYIQSEPEKRLGYLSNSIPMVNSSESTRVAMGVNMLKQSLHAEGAEKPLVYARSLRSDLISLISPVSGLVTETTNGMINIDTGDEITSLKIPEIPTIKDTKISYRLRVSAGEHVSKNQVLASPVEFEAEGTGVNLIVAYASYKFKEHEDALIISESAAKKLAVKQDVIASYNITDCKVNFLIEEGATIDSDTVVLSYSKKSKGKYKSQIIKNETIRGLRYRGTVTKIVKKDDTIKFKVSTLNLSGVGNKITNRYGSKGVVGEVLPDDLMPRFEINDRTYIVDVIMNPEAVYSRKNYSQFNESQLGLIAKIMYDDYLDKGVDYVNSKYEKVLGHKVTEPCDIRSFSFNTSSFSKYNSLKIQELAAEAGIDPYQYLYYPEYNTASHTKVEVGVAYLLRLQQIPEYDIRTTPGISNHNLATLGKYKAKGQAVNEMETTAMIAGGAYDLVEHIKSNDAQSRVDKLGLYLLMSGIELTD